VDKLVGIDLEGNLINDDNQIEKATDIAVQTLVKKGVKMAFISNRSLSGIAGMIDKFSLEDFLDYSVCFNGAYVFDHRKNKPLLSHCLRGRTFIEIQNLVSGEDVGVYAYTSEKIILTEMNQYAYVDAYRNNTSIGQLSHKDMMNEPMIYQIVIAGNSQALDRIEQKILMEGTKNYGFKRYHKDELAIVNLGVSRSEALKAMAESMGIALEEVMVINDVNSIEDHVKAIRGNGVEKAQEALA